MSITDISSAHGGLIYCIYWHNEDVAEHLFDWHADHIVWLTRCVMSSHIGPQPPAGYTQASGIEWICHKRILDLVASSRSVAVRSKEDGSIHGGDEWEDKKGFEAKHELVGASPTLRRCPMMPSKAASFLLFLFSVCLFLFFHIEDRSKWTRIGDRAQQKQIHADDTHEILRRSMQ